MTIRSDDYLENAGDPQKLEWVTPKISLMEAGETEGSGKTFKGAEFTDFPVFARGPS